MLELREYANNGGKLLVDGRNVHQTFTASGSSLSATGPYTWTPDKLFGFFYPPNNAGDDDLPGTAWQRSRGISNDTWQNYLGVVGRQSGVGVALTTRPTRPTRSITGVPGRAPTAGGLFAGMAPFTLDAEPTDDPNQNADGTAAAAGRASRCACATGARPTSRCARRRSQADFATPVTYTTGGGAIISTRDAVTFCFGLEQVDQATRNELVKRAMSYLLPTTADTTRADDRRLQVPGRPLDGDPARPGRARADRVRRARRHGLRRPQGPDGALDPAHRGLPVPVPLHPAGLGRRHRGHADRGGRGQGGQQVDARRSSSTCVDGDARPRRRSPVNPPSLVGTPTVGSQLSCINGGFLNAPKTLTYAWLRNGAVIAGADRRRRTRWSRPTSARTRRLPDHGDQRRRQRRRDLRRR